MITEWLSETELELIRWYQSLSRWQIAAVQLWLASGDDSQLVKAFSRHHLIVAA